LNELEDWWLRQFKRHFSLEVAGTPPSQLSERWLTLNRMAYGPAKRIQLDLPEVVAHWLDDDDVRAKSPKYPSYQMREVEDWLNG
jgi:hypothetical protein